MLLETSKIVFWFLLLRQPRQRITKRLLLMRYGYKLENESIVGYVKCTSSFSVDPVATSSSLGRGRRPSSVRTVTQD
jgi:hypothetical protein